MLALSLALLLGACGVLRPTPARFHPQLPETQRLPGPQVEDLVEQLEVLGFECWFDPGGDIPSGWNCRRGNQDNGDWSDVSVGGAESGAIESVGAARYIILGPDTGPEPAVLDEAATALFDETVIALVIPADQRPSTEELYDGVLRNVPMELGEGWFLDFERSSITRTMRVVFAPDAEGS